ncbi:MAG: hypothetical protein ACK5NT_02385 [Pyrinomonadaceae bacterium]
MKITPIKLLVACATFAVVATNYIATKGMIGGTTPNEISEKYPTILTPSDYTFRIWGLIFLGVVAFTVYQFIREGSKNIAQIRLLSICVAAVNIAWIFCWQTERILLSTIAIIVLLIILIKINTLSANLEPTIEKVTVKIPFSIYFGWVSIVAVINILVYMRSIGISLDGTGAVYAATAFVILFTVIAFYIKEKLDIPFFALAVVWAFAGIGIKQSGNTALVIACGIGVIVLLFASMTLVLKDPKLKR